MTWLRDPLRDAMVPFKIELEPALENVAAARRFVSERLDGVAPKNPLFVQEGYGQVYANSLALKAVGTPGTSSWPSAFRLAHFVDSAMRSSTYNRAPVRARSSSRWLPAGIESRAVARNR